MTIRKKPSVLFVSSGGRLSPATRYRIYQYIPYLEKEGVDCRVYSIFSEGMTSDMVRSVTFCRFRRFLYYLHVLAERLARSIKVIFIAGRFDIVFLQRTTFPFGMERLLKLRNDNIIFDIDDSIYMPDREEGGILGWLKKAIKKKEVVSVLRVSRCVLVENNHIKNFVQQYCKEAYLITGPIDTVRNFAKKGFSKENEIVIGWIGTPSTTSYFRMLDNVLKELSRKYSIKVRLVGASCFLIDGINLEFVKWSEDSEISELHKFDIGVMPMPDNEWTRGKVGCKMLQYMANAIPAVVSYTPTNAEIIEDKKNGILVRSEKGWVDNLSLLIEDNVLRERIGLEGRKTAEERFSVKENAPKFVRILTEK